MLFRSYDYTDRITKLGIYLNPNETDIDFEEPIQEESKPVVKQETLQELQAVQQVMETVEPQPVCNSSWLDKYFKE